MLSYFGYLVVTVLILYCLKSLRSGSRGIPGLGGLPYFGSYLMYNLIAEAHPKKILDGVFDLHRLHGPTFQYTLFGVNHIVTSDPTLIQQTLFHMEAFEVPLTEETKFVHPEPFLSTDAGESWKRRREALRGYHQTANVRTHVLIVNELVKNFPALITSLLSDQLTVDLAPLFKDYFDSILWRSLLGIEFGGMDESEKRIILEKIFQINGGLLLRERLPKLLWYFPFKTFAEEKELMKTLKPLVQKIVQRRIDSMQESGTSEPKYDALSHLLDSQAWEYTMDRLVNELIGLVIASSASTGTCIHIFSCVAHFREVQTKLQEEIDRHFEELDGESFTLDRLQSMTYLNDVVAEALRLYPFSSFLFRNVVKDITVGGVQFFRGEKIIINNYAHCRDPDLIEDPNVFDPNRATKILNFEFGNSRKVCIGKKLVQSEIRLLLVYTLRKFSLEFTEKPENSVFPFIEGNPFHVRFVPR